MIITIETAIIDRLKEIFQDFEIHSCPVDFDLDDFEFVSPKGCILIRYENENIETQRTLTAVNSNSTYDFTIFMALRYLQHHSESYPYLIQLKKTLNGIPILNKRLELNKLNFELENSGDLWYSATTSITLPIKDEYIDQSSASEIIDELFQMEN